MGILVVVVVVVGASVLVNGSVGIDFFRVGRDYVGPKV